ncbi:methyltransferase [Mycolicibacterium goodii]|uniref:methyltransferase n=1 Tax=Mycolicibacterium goodii TaxID=134601 RepID=UPI001BDC1398|nr:methyltransferase [Mycolicibacterium goodii]MBU8829754.1 methyltransferase [Mycolicibacterium goodii]
MSPTAEADANARLREIVSSVATPYVLGASLALGLPDIFGDENLDASAAAERAGIPVGRLSRLLRILVDLGILVRAGTDGFALSSTGRLLRSDVAGSLRDLVLLGTHPTAVLPWTRLEFSLSTGQPAFDEVFGSSAFDYFAADPKLGSLYNAAMAAGGRDLAAAVADCYDFGRHSRIVDIGGGDGTLLAAVLSRWPTLTGTVFDTVTGTASTSTNLRSAAVADRCSVTVGDFFTSVPEGADLYVLKWILHDWDDAPAAEILGNCRKAMNATDRLLIIDRVIPDPCSTSGSLHPHMSDLAMLVLYGGRERARDEFETLCTTAGFTIEQIDPLPQRYDASLITLSPDWEQSQAIR